MAQRPLCLSRMRIAEHTKIGRDAIHIAHGFGTPGVAVAGIPIIFRIFEQRECFFDSAPLLGIRSQFFSNPLCVAHMAVADVISCKGKSHAVVPIIDIVKTMEK